MVEYALAWQPHSDNMGDDLRALAAMRLLPRVDRVLDADRLDAALPGLAADDRVVALLSGSVLRESAHWPPEEHIAPVCVGIHVSREDVWGVPFDSVDGAGLAALLASGAIGCRDAATVALLEKADIPCMLTGCVTLTLERPDVPEARRGVCCVDVPESVSDALRMVCPPDDVRDITHRMEAEEKSFDQRMADAEALLAVYAGAELVVTRRLHCAMACLAIGTPVALLYNSGYEDVTRFAPLDSLVRTMPTEDFLRLVREHGFPRGWTNPPEAAAWREKLLRAVREGLARAEAMPLPVVPVKEAEAWRVDRLRLLTTGGAEKIRRLELEQYETLHDKFTLLMREDGAKSTLSTLLSEPEVRRGLRRAAVRRYLSALPWYRRPWARLRIRRGKASVEDLHALGMDCLNGLGWPNHGER